MIKKAGFGGGCHWCTEAVFSSLKGVVNVQQGWIASKGEDNSLSEGIILEYDTDVISLYLLVAIHLHTHSATSLHAMRNKYRSAVYTFNEEDVPVAEAALKQLKDDFEEPIITRVLPMCDFKLNIEEQLNYYFTDAERPFCKTYINPKLKLLLHRFRDVTDEGRLGNL